MDITVFGRQSAYLACDAVRIALWKKSDRRVVTMHRSTSSNDPELPLEIGGYEATTATNVFILTRSLDTQLKRTLENKGYVQRANIVLSDGQIIDGWIKL